MKNAPVTALAISANGMEVISGSQVGAQGRFWPELRVAKSLPTKLANVHDLAFSHDGKQVLVAGGDPGESGGLKIWGWDDAKLVVSSTPHTDLIYRAAWSSRGDRIITASADGTVKVLDGKTLAVLGVYSGHSRAVLSAAWAPGEEFAVTASVDQTIQLWDVSTGKRVRALSNHVGAVNEVAFQPKVNDGPPVLASISEDRTLRLWQPTIGRLMRFTKLSSPPRTLHWLPSGKYLVVGCNDGKVRVVDFEELRIVDEQEAYVGRIHSLCIHPTDPFAIVGGEKGVQALVIKQLQAN